MENSANKIIINLPALKLIKHNLFEGFNLVLDDLCLNKYTHALHINIKNSLDKEPYNNSHSDNEQLIMDKRYDIMVDGMKIYSGILSHDNIYPNKDPIPFNLLDNHKIVIIIRDVEKELFNENHIIELFNYSQTIVPQLMNINDCVSIRWPPYVDPFENKENLMYRENRLRFRSGMCGMTRNYEAYEKSYILENKNDYVISNNNFKTIKLNHLNTNNEYKLKAKRYVDESTNKLVHLMAEYNVDICMETIKVRLDDNTYKFNNESICSGDAVTNISIITDNIIYSVKINNKMVDMTQTNNEYKLTECDDIKHYIVVGRDAISIEISIDETDESIKQPMWIKYDRCVYNSPLRIVSCNYACDTNNLLCDLNVDTIKL
jgi:hypothetical protein